MKVFVVVTDTHTFAKAGKFVCDFGDVERLRRCVAKRHGDDVGMHHIAFSCNVNDTHVMKECNPHGYDLHLLEAAYNEMMETKP
jgi:hypothetical protein